jgi:hypothetical protein
LDVAEITIGSGRVVWWRCSSVSTHEWQSKVNKRTLRGHGCSVCNTGWNRISIEHFVRSLRDVLANLTAAELFVVFQQSGLLTMTGKGKSFMKALATGRFPEEEIEKFVDGESSMVDQFFDDKEQTLEAALSEESDEPNEDDEIDDQTSSDFGAELPTVKAKDVLEAVDAAASCTTDEEAVEFLIASAKAKLWKHAYRNEEEAVAQAKAAAAGEYAERVRDTFLREHQQASELELPAGYDFKVGGKLAKPNLMQRCVANRVLRERRVGNWSGTGAGKTLSAVLSSRVVGARLTVICCPNAVVNGWASAIPEIFPDSDVATKTLRPAWKQRSKHRYLVVNYEAFQQSDSPGKIAALLEKQVPDFVVIDEIHYAKQRHVANISRRREVVMAFVTQSAERNPNFRVLGMSATPVINNLQEGKALVEMITGESHDDIETKASVPNCMKLHQRLVTIGSRWMPNYDFDYDQQELEIECSDYVEEVRALGKKGSTVQLEAILTRARLPVIRDKIVPKTLIYTHYLQGIVEQLKSALVEDGWKVGFYTGEDKTGLDGFLHGDVDVLIGSSSIGTGVDGLQHVCDRMIINVLPWTNAEFEQLKGRIFRQGRDVGSKVTMIIPLTKAEVAGEEWSWCKTKMQRLRFKKSIADACVDGVVPEKENRTPAQAYDDLMSWLERLATGQVESVVREKIVVPLPPSVEKKYLGRFGDFSKMNRHWNTTGSGKTHERLEKDTKEWEHYHTLYREARQSWTVVPFEEMIKWFSKREGRRIGDFGCGEAKLAEALADRHEVQSFDHVAINDYVWAGDMAHTPLEDNELDDAVFCLSLMGANFTDYLKEAHRVLKIDGLLHIWEATSRFKDRDGFVEGLRRLGFDVAGGAEDEGKFTRIRALRTTRAPGDVAIEF